MKKFRLKNFILPHKFTIFSYFGKTKIQTQSLSAIIQSSKNLHKRDEFVSIIYLITS